MADNLNLGGFTLATKDVSGVHHQRQVLHGRAQAAAANLAGASNAAAVLAMLDRFGRGMVIPNNTRERVSTGNIHPVSTTETPFLTKVGSNMFLDIVMLLVTNSGNATVLTIRDKAASENIRLSLSLNAGGGASLYFPIPMKQITANEDWTAQLSSATTLSVWITALSVKAA